MFGLKTDWELDVSPRYFALEDYQGAQARWCPGCGDHTVLTAVQRILRDNQLPPEKTVFVSGIGCSSRFPHYVHSYGFHGLHGRALPVACGVKARRPDLDVWVATGDGDCCSIGAGHWVHAVRYNMDMVVMVFDNNCYALTKNQTSPTSKRGLKTNTHPFGAWLPPLNPVQTTLGISNVSFVATTVDWNSLHLYETLKIAHAHRGLSFVHIAQRCPHYTPNVFVEFQQEPARLLLLTHEKGVRLDPQVEKMFPNRLEHDPSDLDAARRIAAREDVIPIGVLYRNDDLPCYDEYMAEGLGMTAEEKLRAIEQEFDRFAI